MAIAVEMPKMSDTMEEGVLVAWLAEEGDTVTAGDVIAQVETDKATMDLEVYDDGVLLKRVIDEGSSVAIGGLIAVLGKEGEDPAEILAKYGSGDGAAPAAKSDDKKSDDKKSDDKKGDDKSDAKADSKPESSSDSPAKDDSDEASGADMASSGDGDGRIKSSPLARRLASEHGIELSKVSGSGPEGRIVRRDIEAAMGSDAPARSEKPAAREESATAPRPQAGEAKAAPAPDGRAEDRSISQMRKTIARRLAESKFTAPHFYLTVDVDMKKALAFRKQINEVSEAKGLARISVNDLITKACAFALRKHPYVNASYLEKEGVLRFHDDVNVAIAVAIDEGLVTPVVRNADRKGLAEIAAETRELAGKARDRKLDPSDWEGSTFTTSNLGMFGIEEFTAIINPPNACILAIGGIRDEAVVRDGQVVPGKRMKLTLSCDHRIVDGASGAEFLGTVRSMLEEPMNMLL
jgi:pyruvate dehydrogenase E2 component (dihydrolipoamide acetyltransferase)